MTKRLEKLLREWRDPDAFKQPDLSNAADKVKALMAICLESDSVLIAAEALNLAREITYALIPDDGRPLSERIADKVCSGACQQLSMGLSRAKRLAVQGAQHDNR